MGFSRTKLILIVPILIVWAFLAAPLCAGAEIQLALLS